MSALFPLRIKGIDSVIQVQLPSSDVFRVDIQHRQHFVFVFVVFGASFVCCASLSCRNLWLSSGTISIRRQLKKTGRHRLVIEARSKDGRHARTTVAIRVFSSDDQDLR